MKLIEDLNKFLGTNESGCQHELSNYDKIKSISYDVLPKNNPSITLYCKRKQFFVHFDHVTYSEYFLMDCIYEIKKAIKKPKKLLKDIAEIWILTSCYDRDEIRVQTVAWGLRNIWDYGVRNDYIGKTKIMVRKCFNDGYSPIDYLRDQNRHIIIYENFDAAYEAMCGIDNDSYTLQENEASRPDFWIVADVHSLLGN
ncbi:MAG: hypothetical protein JNK39_08155 [Nitrosomonas sp.]|nr:hypothetical protein [Nitrosomonas sp.]